MMKPKLFIITSILFILFIRAGEIEGKFDFKIRTITAGVTLLNLSDTVSIIKAIEFLKNSRAGFIAKGYEVQTIRISTQNLYEMVEGKLSLRTIQDLKRIDRLIGKHNVGLAIGQILNGNEYDPDIAKWCVALTKETSNTNFSVSIASVKNGIHDKTIKAAAEICKALGHSSKGGEDNFRFTASANCPDGIPFFPAAYHHGINSFAIGLEYPNVISKVFRNSDWSTASVNLKTALEAQMKPIESMAIKIGANAGWQYDGIDTSPAPGLEASIGGAIESLTKKPFGQATTLSACSMITSVIKNLDVKMCGYSGLMLPIIEDKVLAKRALEHEYTVEELLLFSSVSGTGLDVVPIAGNTTVETMEGVYRDAAALSLKYFNKALSVRLFPIPGKEAGDVIEFEKSLSHYLGSHAD